jgi:hypothetical protein
MPAHPSDQPTLPLNQPPDKWAGRVAVPGSGPSPQPVPPTAPTMAPLFVARRRSGLRRFLGVIVALILLVAVPVVSAYVSYKLAMGENPFEWPPTMDLSKVF